MAYNGIFGARTAGRVTADGGITLQVSAVHATGRLAGEKGLGRWESEACKGSWMAERL